MSEKNNKNKRGFFMTNSRMLIIRMLIGAYLIYIAWSVKGSAMDATVDGQMFFLIACIVFGVLGILLIVHSALCLKDGKYIGGSADPLAGQEEEERVEEESKSRITFSDEDDL